MTAENKKPDEKKSEEKYVATRNVKTLSGLINKGDIVKKDHKEFKELIEKGYVVLHA
jgi:hypothetical protein